MPPLRITLYPLSASLSEVAAFWVAVDVGYYLILPKLGYALSYNTAPIPNAIYFLVCAALIMLYFHTTLTTWFMSGAQKLRFDIYLLQTLALGTLVGCTLYFFSRIGIVIGFDDAPYTDILLATAWYFLPKAAEILVQQALITVSTIAFWYYFQDFKKVLIGYFVYFVGAHIFTSVLSHAPLPYATILTVSAALSTFLFPYLILRVHGGFIHAYAFHVLFYLILAITLHTWPPLGYAIL